MPIDATTGNNKEFSCIDASSILPTDEVMDPTLDSIVVSAFSNVEPNLDTSCFNLSSSSAVSSKIASSANLI